MIWKLVLKDLRAFGLNLLLMLVCYLAFSCFMAANDRSASWWLFLIIGSGQVSILIPAYFGFEKYYKSELLTCSLPITRNHIVLARMLTSVTCPPKRDPIVILGSKEESYGENKIHHCADHREITRSRSITISRHKHRDDL